MLGTLYPKINRYETRPMALYQSYEVVTKNLQNILLKSCFRRNFLTVDKIISDAVGTDHGATNDF